MRRNSVGPGGSTGGADEGLLPIFGVKTQAPANPKHTREGFVQEGKYP